MRTSSPSSTRPPSLIRRSNDRDHRRSGDQEFLFLKNQTPDLLIFCTPWGQAAGESGYCDVVVISSSFASSAENPHCSGSKSPHSSTAGFSVFARGLRVGGGRCSWVRRRSMS